MVFDIDILYCTINKVFLFLFFFVFNFFDQPAFMYKKAYTIHPTKITKKKKKKKNGDHLPEKLQMTILLHAFLVFFSFSFFYVEKTFFFFFYSYFDFGREGNTGIRKLPYCESFER